MAISVQFEFAGMNPDQYDNIVQDLIDKGLGAPDGRIYHVACPSDDGMFLFGIWESVEKLGRFSESLKPLMIERGIAVPQPVIRPVHKIIAE